MARRTGSTSEPALPGKAFMGDRRLQEDPGPAHSLSSCLIGTGCLAVWTPYALVMLKNRLSFHALHDFRDLT